MAEIRHSVCALDCPDCCSLLVTVEDGRGTKLRGDSQHPVTRGFLCGKVAQYLEREYSPGRLLYPQRRVGDKGEGRCFVPTVLGKIEMHPADQVPGRMATLEELLQRLL